MELDGEAISCLQQGTPHRHPPRNRCISCLSLHTYLACPTALLIPPGRANESAGCLLILLEAKAVAGRVGHVSRSGGQQKGQTTYLKHACRYRQSSDDLASTGKRHAMLVQLCGCLSRSGQALLASQLA